MQSFISSDGFLIVLTVAITVWIEMTTLVVLAALHVAPFEKFLDALLGIKEM